MPYFEWTPDLELGIDLIDHDHKVLVSLLNQAHDCIGAPEERATLGSVLNALVEYTEYHFAREEQIMESAGYSELEEHRDLHRRLTRQANEVRARFAVDPKDVQAEEVLQFLKDWLRDHIMGQDLRFRPHVLSRPEALATAQRVAFDGTKMQDSGSEASGADMDVSRLSVLVVDDNENFQVILRTIFRGLGCPNIRLVGSGAEGLDALERAEPQLIIVDWRMQGMDGLTFVRAVREKGCSVPIVMISGYGEPGFADQAVAAGVNAFLEKPITARGLLRTIGQAMANA